MKRSVFPATVVVATALFAVACGSSSDSSGGGGGSSSASSTASGGAEAAGARGGTLITRANAAPPGSPDPQVNYTAQEWQFLILTHDGLVGFKRAGGAEGSKLVADLATEVPKPTDNGTTYTFTLRPNIKFSDGKAVTAADVKATFERLFKIGDSPNAGTWYSVIKGADAWIKTPKSCDLTGGVDVSGNQITFHLTGPDPEFLQKLAVPFAFILPKDTPSKNVDFPPPGHRPVQVDGVRAQLGHEGRAQHVLQGVVEGRAARRPAGRHRPALRPERRRRRHPGRERPGRLGVLRRLDPVRPPQRAEHEVRQAGPHRPAAGDVLLRVQHDDPAVRQRQGPPGRQLRDRPQRADQALRRPEAREPDVPGPAARLPRPTSPTARTRSTRAAASGRVRTWPRRASSSRSPGRRACR